MTMTRIRPLILFGAVLAALDSLLGVLVSLGLDLRRPEEAAFAISFVLTLPTYFMDAWIRNRYPFLLIALFTLRWLILCLGEAHFALLNPLRWPAGPLLVATILVLQVAKFRGDGLRE